MLPVKTKNQKVEAFDLDDVLFRREKITRFCGFLKGKFGYTLLNYTADTLPDLDHTPVNCPIKGIKEQISFNYHRRRVALPGIADKLKAKVAQGIKLVALSGRPATIDWYEMTMDQLKREDLPISEVILTPHGVQTSISKAHGIKITGASVFNDDDLKTQLFLSGVFPEKQFNWIHHFLPNISINKEILATRSNLTVVPIVEWMNK